jgi:hypothetical protein
MLRRGRSADEHGKEDQREEQEEGDPAEYVEPSNVMSRRHVHIVRSLVGRQHGARTVTEGLCEQEAEEVTRDIERQVMESTGAELDEPDDTITINQRKSIPLWEITKAIVSTYPKRTVLGLALFIGQAFLYNAILFGYATLLSKFFGVATANAPYYLVAFAVGNLAGPLVLGPLFDSVGRKPMIAGTYILSGVLLLITGYLFEQHQLTAASLTVAWSVVFFFASAGVSAAYLTVSEIFPWRRALWRSLCSTPSAPESAGSSALSCLVGWSPPARRRMCSWRSLWAPC